ncbi:MAG: tetratricopeptide repeat protein, partial [Xanthomonadales bacterium]|nr:tetratricopeptide repeat protein [Xanthomonadales bacterium]
MGHPHLSGNAGDETAQARHLRDHLRRQPGDGTAWLALAQLLARQPPGPELHHALEQAIQSGPESIDAWLLAARVHRRQRGVAAALQWLAHWSRQNPGLAAPRTAAATLRAEAAREAGQWQEALAAYREIEKARPQDPVTLNDIGSCLASMEAWDEAESYFEGALEKQPEFAEARLNLGLLQACQGRDEAAVQELDRVLARPGVATATRGAAESLRETLAEHRRLQPWLDRAVQTGSVDELQQALRATPDSLCRPHAESVERLRALAAPCRSLGAELAAGGGTPGREEMQRLEALV